MIRWLGMLFCSFSFSYQMNLEPLPSNGYRLTVTSTAQDLAFQPIPHEGKIYYQVNLEGGNDSFAAGEPNLPRLRQLIAIPEGKNFSVNATFSESRSFEDILVSPVSGAAIEGKIPTFFFDLKTYQRPHWVIKKRLVLEPVTFIGSQRVQPITIIPMNYHPKKRLLTVHEKIVVEIHLKDSPRVIPLASLDIVNFCS